MKPDERSPARVQASAKHTRDYWRTTILSQAALNCSLLGWLEPKESDLRKLPSKRQDELLGKCRELLERCCAAQQANEAQYRILRRMNAELWNFMTQLAPSKVLETARANAGETADLFPPHEDTQWPTRTKQQ